MLMTQTDNLSQQQKQLVHPDFISNEQAYLQMRDGLLSTMNGLWVAIADGKLVASGSNLMEVMAKASAIGGHPYIAMVGGEDSVVFRARRVTFGYDQTYQPFPLPRVSARFWNHPQTHSQQFDDVIPDTGADVSLLPNSDCKAIDLFSSPYMTGLAAGVIGGAVAALFYQGKVEIDGQPLAALIQPIARGERIIGRDVLNQQRVLFDGPSLQVTFDP